MFMSMRIAASAAHDLQVFWLPRGARIVRVAAVVIAPILGGSVARTAAQARAPSEIMRATAALMPAFMYGLRQQAPAHPDWLAMFQPEHLDTRSQDLEPAYHDAGQWYWLRTEPFLRTRELMGPNCAAVVLPGGEAQDIDHADDWALAELKHQLLQPLSP